MRNEATTAAAMLCVHAAGIPGPQANTDTTGWLVPEPGICILVLVNRFVGVGPSEVGRTYIYFINIGTYYCGVVVLYSSSTTHVGGCEVPGVTSYICTRQPQGIHNENAILGYRSLRTTTLLYVE